MVYETGEEAHKAFKKIKNKHGLLVRPYHCVCGKFHLGRVEYILID